MKLQDALKRGKVGRVLGEPQVPPLSDILAHIQAVPLGRPVDVELATLSFEEAAAWLTEYTASGTRAAGLKIKEVRAITKKTQAFFTSAKTRDAARQIVQVLTDYQSNSEHRKYIGLGLWVWWRTLEMAAWSMRQGKSTWVNALSGYTYWNPDTFRNHKIRGPYKTARDKHLAKREGLLITPYCAHDAALAYRAGQDCGLLPGSWDIVKMDIDNAMSQYETDLADIHTALGAMTIQRDIRPWTVNEHQIIGALKLEGRGYIGQPECAQDARKKTLDFRQVREEAGVSQGMTLTSGYLTTPSSRKMPTSIHRYDRWPLPEPHEA